MESGTPTRHPSKKSFHQLFRDLHGVERCIRDRQIVERLFKGMLIALESGEWPMKTPPSTIAAVCGLFLALDPALAQTWTQTGAPRGGWLSVASSADGTKIVTAAASIGIGGGAIFTSTNSGETWSSNNVPKLIWISVASSVDGTKLVAAANFANIYTSTNAGATWVSNNPPAAFWTSVASSADGTKLIAVASSNLIYTSTDSGATWTSNKAVMDNQPWHSVASSADGSKQAIAADPGVIYISTNSGTTWATVIGAPGTNWQAIVSSAGGTKLAAIARSGLVYTSSDSGATWMSNSLPAGQWTSIASSADGSKLVATACYDNSGNAGPIYVSTNSGTSWTLNASSNNWGFVASSADGSKLVAVLGGGVSGGVETILPGGIWTLQTTPAPQLNLVPASPDLKLSWIVPSTNFVLQQSADLSGWADMTNPPVLNLTNLQDEVILSPTNSRGFYRLKTL